MTKPKPSSDDPLGGAKLKFCASCGNLATWTCDGCKMRLCERCKTNHPAHK